MFTFNGKLNWFKYAVNETITVVFPAGFAVNDPVCAFWQWTEDAAGNKKANTTQLGFINSVTTKTGEYQVSFAFDYYSFEATVAGDSSTITATMFNPKGDRSEATTLNRQFGNLVQFRSTTVFTGKLNWLKYAENEMLTLVVPRGVSNGAPVGLYHQWTVDAKGVKKANHAVNATFRDVTTDKGETKATFDDGYYTYNTTVQSGGQEVKILMSNPNHDQSDNDLKKVYGY
ncbi:hypothetical protein E1B28_003624 [Marasmius oreades]|uniref:Uncharacterized protein n=1 Tax=Marasmius oreades TaxID=181124 RepID=A0A9P7RMY6_9AGAR|nr:uncharacterized protein E1B28_003624 [Marasmius oreades]KAG7086110.1 hypothetical protein E1B28_003624 [Marasmius oreades]